MTKERFQRITFLALPIIGGMLSQNLLNLVDTAMVGSLGNAALAAVGLGGFASFLGQSLILGISVGVQATSSRRKGEGKLNEMALPLNAGLLIVILSGIALSAVLYQVIPTVYPYLNSDPEVIKLGVPYLQIRIFAVTIIGINFAFRGYWNAVDLSKLYMISLIATHLINIFLNYVLIYGKWGFPELGVSGAALGTAISPAIGCLFHFFFGYKFASASGFLKSLPSWEEIGKMIRLSLPNGVQQFFFAGGFTATYWIIGKVGTAELAAANVLINLMLLAILPSIGLGLASATLVGQALGRKDIEDAKRWPWDVIKVGFAFLSLLSLTMIGVPEVLLQIFLKDPVALELAILPMRFTGVSILFDLVGLVLLQSLLGAGDSKTVMYTSIFFQWFYFLPLAYLAGPVLGYGLLGIWLLQISYRGFQALCLMFLWKREDWAKIVV